MAGLTVIRAVDSAIGSCHRAQPRALSPSDVTVGNNTFGGVTGYNAAPAFDMASGLGTIDATQLVRELAR